MRPETMKRNLLRIGIYFTASRNSPRKRGLYLTQLLRGRQTLATGFNIAGEECGKWVVILLVPQRLKQLTPVFSGLIKDYTHTLTALSLSHTHYLALTCTFTHAHTQSLTCEQSHA